MSFTKWLLSLCRRDLYAICNFCKHCQIIDPDHKAVCLIGHEIEPKEDKCLYSPCEKLYCKDYDEL